MGDMQDTDFTTAIRMKNVSIQYEGKPILQDVNWAVQRGDRWWASGANGAGKSTLLSLIMGDNPQAYANEIYLFDRRREAARVSGTSNAKQGMFRPRCTSISIILLPATTQLLPGLFDTIGLFRQLTPEQDELVRRWISLMGLEKKRTMGLAGFQPANKGLRCWRGR